jgi:hypothetical protein
MLSLQCVSCDFHGGSSSYINVESKVLRTLKNSGYTSSRIDHRCADRTFYYKKRQRHVWQRYRLRRNWCQASRQEEIEESDLTPWYAISIESLHHHHEVRVEKKEPGSWILREHLSSQSARTMSVQYCLDAGDFLTSRHFWEIGPCRGICRPRRLPYIQFRVRSILEILDELAQFSVYRDQYPQVQSGVDISVGDTKNKFAINRPTSYSSSSEF